MSSKFDEDVDHLSSAINKLRSERVALVFCASAQRLSTLYTAFCAETDWRPQSDLAEILRTTWQAVKTQNVISLTPRTLAVILEGTPDADAHDSILTVPAQDYCICLESAVRCVLGNPKVCSQSIDANLEAIRVLLSYKLTGFIDFPDTDEFHQATEQVRSDERYKSEIERIRIDIQDAGNEPFTYTIVEAVRQRAIAAQWSFDRLGVLCRNYDDSGPETRSERGNLAK
jgi:uncharacterized protein YjaG (DUF416 family)